MAPVPSRTALGTAFPNPFSGQTTVRLSMSATGPASLRVYDVSGRTIRVLFEGAMPAGGHLVHWDATRSDGSAAHPGAYFYELRTSGERLTRRLLLLR
jgi:flagellar hook assembly protein FlgD